MKTIVTRPVQIMVEDIYRGLAALGVLVLLVNLLAAGGIGSGRQMAAAMAMGAMSKKTAGGRELGASASAGGLGPLADLLGDPERRRRLGEQGQLHAIEHYSWDRVAARTGELYRELVPGAQKRRTGG